MTQTETVVLKPYSTNKRLDQKINGTKYKALNDLCIIGIQYWMKVFLQINRVNIDYFIIRLGKLEYYIKKSKIELIISFTMVNSG